MTVIDLFPDEEINHDDLRELVMRLAGAYLDINNQLAQLQTRVFRLETKGDSE